MILDLSIRLRELRVSKHLRQEQVAKMIGVTKSTISAYENDLRQPSFEVLLKFANLYCVSTDYLLGRTDTVSMLQPYRNGHRKNGVVIGSGIL